MKKVSVNQYAEAIYQSTKDLAGHELSEALKNFVLILAKNNSLKFSDKIIAKFQQVYNQHEGIEEVEVTSQRKLDDTTYHEISSWLKHNLKKEIQLSKKVDEALGGGVIIRYQDVILDDSLSTKLANLKNSLIK